MNLRTTPLLFGLVLGILWLFGLALVYKKGAVEESFLMPSMQGTDVKVDAVTFEYKTKDKDKEGPQQVDFILQNELWYVVQSGIKVRVENFRIDDMVREVKNAKRFEEERVQNDTAYYDLPPGGQPFTTVTLKGKRRDTPKEWKFFIGKQGAAGSTVFVNTSDRPGRAFPVLRSSIESLFFKDVADLRPKRLFDVVESLVTFVDIHQGSYDLALRKTENTWRFEKPALGFAGFESSAVGEDIGKQQSTANSVKSLIGNVTAIHVDNEKDFEPIGVKSMADYGLKDGEEQMRIVLGTGNEKPRAKDEKDEKAEKKDEGKREVLLIGNRVKQLGGSKSEPQVYARMAGDEGVFRILAKYLDPIKTAVEDPKRIRSKDVVLYDAKKIDAVVVASQRTQKDDKVHKTEFKLLHPPEKDWQVAAKDEKVRKGNEKAILALIEAIEGKNEIAEFADKVDESWGGLKGPNTTELSLYIDGIEKKKDEKKDEKKTDKKAAKKDEKKDDKETAAELKKGEPFVKLVIGTVDKEKKIAHVKRVLQDGTVSHFTVPLAYVEKLHLDEGPLAYLDLALPGTQMMDVVAVDLQRGKDTVKLDRFTDMIDRWMLSDVHDPEGKPADPDKVRNLVRTITTLTARKWLRKDDAEKFGLKEPSLTVTLHTRKMDRIEAVEAASLMGLLAARSGFVVLPPLGFAAIHRLGPPLGETVTVKFGKEIEEDKQKMVYAEHSGTDLVFLVPAAMVKSIRDADFRDRSGVKYTQAKLGATLVGLTAVTPLIAATPLNTGVIHGFDPGKVNEVNLTLRTRVELRSFTFSRVDKTWVDRSGTKEFNLDAEKVSQLLDKVCKLRTERFASFGGPTGENKLTQEEATLQIELKFDDKTRVTLTVGGQFEALGYFANSSAWREAVFFVPSSLIDPWLQGATYFGKERAAGL
jgi:hypothetical protein